MKLEQALEQKIWAVVGATPRTEKFGYKVFQALLTHGYTVYPIHPIAETIDGVSVYRSLYDLPERPDVVCLIVPESVGLQTLDQCEELGLHTVWMQPGADTALVLDTISRRGMTGLQGCVLVELEKEGE